MCVSTHQTKKNIKNFQKFLKSEDPPLSTESWKCNYAYMSVLQQRKSFATPMQPLTTLLVVIVASSFVFQVAHRLVCVSVIAGEVSVWRGRNARNSLTPRLRGRYGFHRDDVIVLTKLITFLMIAYLHTNAHKHYLLNGLSGVYIVAISWGYLDTTHRI